MVTDQNGCTATETININSYCDDIRMANTFTPNGDGINDTWTITGLENDASSNVKVFNRSGSLIFESRGYATPWNGTRNGQQLPAGSYYYLINTKNNKRVLSGTVTIIY
jgi:gliding motility-associated-like protein